MLANYSVKDLYALALAEGEGMGTAYEYYVKRMALRRFLYGRSRPTSILIAGLPERYGASLDFILLGIELGATVTVVDDRPLAIERLQGSLEALANYPGGPPLNPPGAVVLADLNTLAAINGRFDLVLSSEVLQRLSASGRQSYVGRLGQLALVTVLFCPNADNQAHNSISGLAGLRLEELRALTTDDRPQTTDHRPIGEASPHVVRRRATGVALSVVSSGYIDMPPFPPGITRSAAQREEATSGRFEALVMWGLERYAHIERFFPHSVRRRQSHIVYAFVEA
jgi:hypothetical protein